MAWAALALVLIEVVCHLCLPTSAIEMRHRLIRERVAAGSPVGIQLMGDSVAANGILISLVDSGKETIRNDALEGAGPISSYLLLREEIAAHRAPSYLILAHSPHTFAGWRYRELIGRFAYWSEVPELVWKSESISDAIYGVLTRFSYILSYRDQFYYLVRGRTRFLKEWAAPAKSESERLATYRELVEKGQFRPTVLPAGITGVHKDPFRVSPLVDYYYRRLLSLAQANGVKVYWLSMPVPERVSAFRARLNYDRDFFGYLDQFVANGQLRYLQREFPAYPDTVFDDLSHLNMEGAMKFSLHLRELWEAESP